MEIPRVSTWVHSQTRSAILCFQPDCIIDGGPPSARTSPASPPSSGRHRHASSNLWAVGTTFPWHSHGRLMRADVTVGRSSEILAGRACPVKLALGPYCRVSPSPLGFKRESRSGAFRCAWCNLSISCRTLSNRLVSRLPPRPAATSVDKPFGDAARVTIQARPVACKVRTMEMV